MDFEWFLNIPQSPPKKKSRSNRPDFPSEKHCLGNTQYSRKSLSRLLRHLPGRDITASLRNQIFPRIPNPFRESTRESLKYIDIPRNL